MTLKTNNAEGQASGTTLNIGNSGGGSGDAFSSVTGSVAFSNAFKSHGTNSYLFTPAAAQTNTVMLTDGGSSANFTVRFYVPRLTGYPSAETIFADVQTAAGATVCRIHLTTAGALKLVNNAGSTVVTFTNVLALNTAYRIEFWGTVNATTGTMNVSLFAGDSTSAIETKNQTNVNTGSTFAGRFVVGKITAAPTMAQFYIDDIAADMNSSSPLGPVVNAAPTVVSDTANLTVAAAGTANMSFTSTDADGTIASLATTFDFPTSGAPALTGGTTSTPSFTAGSAPNLYVVRQTATDNLGATGSGTVEVRVPTTGTIAPLAGYTPVTTGTFTNVGGAGSIGAALRDASDATYAESAALSASEQELRVRLDPSTTRSALSVTFRVSQDTAGTIVAKGRLYEGNTLRQEWTLTTTTSAADQVCALSGATVAAITDWNNLWAAVAGTA